MLRASHANPETLNIAAITATGAAMADSDIGFEPGAALIALADAVCAADETRLKLARAGFGDRPPEYIAGAVAVAANFQMMNRVLDSTGLPVNSRFAGLGEELGFTEEDWHRE